jgi:hypothetical protein
MTVYLFVNFAKLEKKKVDYLEHEQRKEKADEK